jgi:hypothetical protein
VDLCPGAPPERGRDPVCVALASRSPALCAAAPPADVPRCVAIARNAPAGCDALDPLLRPRCRGDVAALAGIVPRSIAAPLARGTVHLRLTLGAVRALPDGGAARSDAGAAVREWDLELAARGAYAGEDGNVFLIDPQRGWPSELATVLSSDRPIVALALTPPARARPGPGALVDVRVVMPDGRAFNPAPGGTAQVQFTRVPRGRGDAIEGTVSADVLASPAVPARVEISFRTFVRDTVAPAALGWEPRTP